MYVCVYINMNVCICIIAAEGFECESIGACYDNSISSNSSYTVHIRILKNLALINPTPETLKEPPLFQ